LGLAHEKITPTFLAPSVIGKQIYTEPCTVQKFLFIFNINYNTEDKERCKERQKYQKGSGNLLLLADDLLSVLLSYY